MKIFENEIFEDELNFPQFESHDLNTFDWESIINLSNPLGASTYSGFNSEFNYSSVFNNSENSNQDITIMKDDTFHTPKNNLFREEFKGQKYDNQNCFQIIDQGLNSKLFPFSSNLTQTNFLDLGNISLNNDNESQTLSLVEKTMTLKEQDTLKSIDSIADDKESKSNLFHVNQEEKMSDCESSSTKVVIPMNFYHKNTIKENKIKIKKKSFKPTTINCNGKENTKLDLTFAKEPTPASSKFDNIPFYNTIVNDGLTYLKLWEDYYFQYKTSQVRSKIMEMLSHITDDSVEFPGESTIYDWAKILKTHIFLNLNFRKDFQDDIFEDSFFYKTFQDIKSDDNKFIEENKLKEIDFSRNVKLEKVKFKYIELLEYKISLLNQN